MSESTFALTFFAPVAGLKAKTVPSELSKHVSEDRILPGSSTFELKERGILLVITRYAGTGGRGPLLTLMLCQQIYETVGATTGRSGHAFGVQINVWGNETPSAEFLERSLRKAFIPLRDASTRNGTLKEAQAFEAFVTDFEERLYGRFVQNATAPSLKSIDYFPELGVQPNGEIGFVKTAFDWSPDGAPDPAMQGLIEWAMHSPSAQRYHRILVASEQAGDPGGSLSLIPGDVRLGVNEIVWLARRHSAHVAKKQALEAKLQTAEGEALRLRDELKNKHQEFDAWKSRHNALLGTTTASRGQDAELVLLVGARFDRLSRELTQSRGMMEQELGTLDGRFKQLKGELGQSRESAFWWRLTLLIACILIAPILGVGLAKKVVAGPILTELREVRAVSSQPHALSPISDVIGKLEKNSHTTIGALQSEVEKLREMVISLKATTADRAPAPASPKKAAKGK